MTKDQIEILEKIKADSSKQKALDYLIKSFPELNEDYILCEVANYEIDGFDYRNPVVHRYIAYVDAVKELQEESNYNLFQRCRECEGLHKENGNCIIVGGFYTSVPDALCPKIKEKVKLALENKELAEENRQLKNDYEMIDNCFLIAKNENKKLQEQIEKMKCCSNCSKVYVRKEDGLVCCSVGSFHINADGKGCKEWELAE